MTGRGIEQINIRVVPGATGHFKPANIAPGDDVLICSLHYLRRCVNFYYQRGAVEAVEIGQRREGLRTWQIWLFQGNDPAWLAPHLPHLATQIREVREYDGLMPAPDQIVIAG